ncbi:MAG: hypothetical protein O3C27_09200 [Actinomycetota bacterium]|nr:hypothetical protein [Actinomycetota bacterium]
MTDSFDIGAWPMDGRMEQKSDGVDGPLAEGEVAVMVGLHQIGDLDAVERDTEGVGPETVEVLGIAHGDVAQQPFGEPELAEDATGGRQALEPMATLLGDGGEGGAGANDES